MIVLWVLFIFLFLLLLLAMPVVVTAKVRVSPAGAVIRANASFFGTLSLPVKARINLFHPPYLTVEVFGRTLPLLGKQPKLRLDERSIRAERLDLDVTLGLEHDGARTVQLLGTIEVLLGMVLPLYVRRVRVLPHPSFSREMFRMKLDLIGLVFPLFLFFRVPRIKRKSSAHDTDNESKEKRYVNVPG